MLFLLSITRRKSVFVQKHLKTSQWAKKVNFQDYKKNMQYENYNVFIFGFFEFEKKVRVKCDRAVLTTNHGNTMLYH